MADYAADLPDEGSRKLLGTNVDGDNDSLDEDEENMVTVVVTNCKTDLVTHAALLAMGLGVLSTLIYVLLSLVTLASSCGACISHLNLFNLLGRYSPTCPAN
jgi:hypothetical protein